MLTIEANAVPSRAAGVYEHELAGELLLMSGELPQGLTLNPSASAIWRLCDGRRTLHQIAAEIASEVSLPAERLLTDIQGAVAQLAAARLLEVGIDQWIEASASIDWTRVATLQDDLSDAKLSLDLLGERQGSPATRPPDDGSPTIAGGKVAVRYCYGDSVNAGLDRAPLDHPNIAAAERFLDTWPLGRRAFEVLIHSVHPLIYAHLPTDESFFLDRSHCHSAEEMPGTMWSTINCPMMLAEAFVHEMAHQKLFGLGIMKESCIRLIANDPDDLFHSPVITAYKRPMTAVVHGVYAYAYVTELDLRVAAAADELGLDAEHRRRVALRVRENAARLEQGQGEIRTHLRTDADGALFFPPFFAWIDDLIRRSRERERA